MLAPPSETTLSPSWSMRSWSRVTGGLGSRSRMGAGGRMSQNGRCRAGRRVPSAASARDQNSFQSTTSGPPSSTSDARRLLTASVTARARSSDPDRLQALRAASDHGRHRREPGDPRELRQGAAVAGEDEARPQDRVAEARSADGLLHRPLGAVVRNGVLRLARSCRARSCARSAPRLLRRRPRAGSQCPASSRARSRQACRRGSRRDGRSQCSPRPPRAGSRASVTSPRTSSQSTPSSAAAPARIAHERPHPLAGSCEPADDVATDEAARARDEDHAVSSKFFQYRLGVGPRWPWYFEPSPLEPYGCSAGSDICTNDSWPIFISG